MPLIAGKDTKSASSHNEWRLQLTKKLNAKKHYNKKEKNQEPDRWAELTLFDRMID